MCMRASKTRTVGRTGLTVTALGMGTAAMGGLYAPVSAEASLEALEAAWQAGIRYFDSAPMYGLGRSEHLLGHFLREKAGPDASFTVSTKVGRLMARERPGRDLPPALPKNPLDSGWHNGLPFREVFDYSYDAIMRSFDDSGQRTGLERLDLLFVHDIGSVTHGDAQAGHWAALTKGGGFRALEELKAAGLVGGFGLGVNEAAVVLDAMNETALDCTLLAGRHTLLEQNALDLLEKARKAGMGIMIGGVFNSGILAAGPGGHRKFNYQDVPEAVARRVDALTAACEHFGVPLSAAAIQYPLRHPAVTAVLIGPRDAGQVRQNVEWFEQDLPAELWQTLEREGLAA
ncbi:aldo/keto reductase [Shinella zoogloeoides]|uniref:aldo/keto reductase n=1 Tax=Shinella zoogloeoides TaxID=352475 RepID=UPI0028A8B93F|nr:aldo/keto reductase [Shinella zoogloeoides]